MKICVKCKNEKSHHAFYQNKGNKDGLYSYCKSCHIKLTTAKRSRRRSRDHTKDDVLKNRWAAIRGRIGKNDYKNIKLLCTKERYLKEFDNKQLQILYDEWVRSGRTFAMTPSIDRIDPKGHYEISNMRWITLSENSSRGGKNRWVKS